MRKIMSKYLIPASILCILSGMIKETASSQWKRVQDSNITGNTSTEKTATVGSVKMGKKTEYSRSRTSTNSNETSASTNHSSSTTKRGDGGSRMKSITKSSIIQVPGLKYSGSGFTDNSSTWNHRFNRRGRGLVKDSSSRNQTKTNSGSRFEEPTTSYNINRNNTSAEYVESEVVNFKRIRTIDPDENLSVAECTKGQYAPRTMKMYKNNLYKCNLACIMGCEMGYGMYMENPQYIPLDENPVTCYLIKVQANYKIKRFKKVTVKGNVTDINECHCGTYFGPKKFRYCKNVNSDYAFPNSQPLLLEQEGDGEMRLACMNYCNEITSFISLTRERPTLVDCWTHEMESKDIAWRTYLPYGECLERKGDIKCICGIPIYQKAVLNWEKTLMRPEKKFRYILNMTASIREKDDRVHDFAKLIFAPRFYIPIDNDFGDGYKSSSEKPLKYKKSKPPTSLTTSDMSEGEKQFVRAKGSVDTLHAGNSKAPPNMGRSYSGKQRTLADEDSVNQMAVQHTWISESNTVADTKSNATTNEEAKPKKNNNEANPKTKIESRTKKNKESASKKNKEGKPKKTKEPGSNKDEESTSKKKKKSSKKENETDLKRSNEAKPKKHKESVLNKEKESNSKKKKKNLQKENEPKVKKNKDSSLK